MLVLDDFITIWTCEIERPEKACAVTNSDSEGPRVVLSSGQIVR